MSNLTRIPGVIPAGILLLVVAAACSDASAPLTPEPGPLASTAVASTGPVVNTLDDLDDGTCDEVHCSLREAVAAAAEGETITFGVTGHIDVAAGIDLPRSIHIAGPGASSLSIETQTALQVVRIPEGVAVTISGVAIRGAFLSGVENRGTALMERVLVEANRGIEGGGIRNLGTMTLRESTVRENRADRFGGGVMNRGTLLVEDSRIEENAVREAWSAGVILGGGIATTGPLEIRGSSVSRNLVEGGWDILPRGGGIDAGGGASVLIEGSALEGNRITQPVGTGVLQGAAIFSSGSPMTIRNSVLSGNEIVVTAPSGSGRGAGIVHTAGTLGMENVLLVGNTIRGNGTAAAMIRAGETLLRHVTVVDNDSGGGIDPQPAVIFTGISPVQVLNSVIAGNRDARGGGADPMLDLRLLEGLPGSASYRFEGNVLGGVEIGVDFELDESLNRVGVEAPGGLEDLGFAAAPDVGILKTYQVLAGSPVIDLGVGDGCVALDLMGTSRPQGAACDAGAVEHIPPPGWEPDLEGPEITLLEAPLDPIPVGTAIPLRAVADDTETGGSAITAVHASLDGFQSWVALAPVDGAFNGPVEEVQGSLEGLPTPAVLELCVRGTDAAGNTGLERCATVVVYDPSGGFVTGGGWIDSPDGTYAPDPSASGRATFGFVARYRRGAHVPDGQTQFHFRAAGFHFQSSAYEWLVVAGSRAQFKGEGRIQGAEGLWHFMLTAVDGNPDTFRLRIWDPETEETLYDNGAQQPIGAGSIVVHAR